MVGIVRAAHTAREHRIVTGAFTLDSQPARRDPDQRVTPIDGADDSGDELGEAVAPPDVRQLVKQDDTQTFGGPIRGTGWHENLC